MRSGSACAERSVSLICSTSRRFYCAALLLAAVALTVGLLFQTLASAETPTVSIDSLSKSVGEQEAVQVRALDIAAPGLGAWTIDITFDPLVVSVVDCAGEAGSLCNPAYAEDTVRVAGFSIFGEIGDSTLASITFACESEGSSQLDLTLETFIDATAGGPLPIDASIDNGLAICSAPEPSPEPTNEPGPSPEPTNEPEPSPEPSPEPTDEPKPSLDSDKDGCTDDKELGPDEVLGGKRDPANFWDFFDPNLDGAIGLSDFLLLLQHFGATDNNGQASINRNSDPLTTADAGPGTYHPRFDRGAVIGPNGWDRAPPDGTITLTDFLALLVQFGHTCVGP